MAIIVQIGRVRVLEQSLVGGSGSSGIAERAIQSSEQQARIMMKALQEKWRVHVPLRHSVVPWWLIERAAVM